MMRGFPFGGQQQGGAPQQGIPNFWQSMFGNAFGGGAQGAYGQPQNTINSYTQQGQNAINQNTQAGQNLLSPFSQMGQTAGSGLAATQAMYQNPTAAYNQFASQYQMSPGAQFQLQNGMQSVQNAMAQNGLGGSGHEAEALSQYTQGLINQDMNSQWNNILNGQKMGLNAGNTLFGGGVNAAGRGADLYGQAGQGSADLYRGAGEDIAGLQEAQIQAQMQQQQQNQQDAWGGIGTVGGLLFGGGSGGGIWNDLGL